jgi:hypothetical protein
MDDEQKFGGKSRQMMKGKNTRVMAQTY